MEGRTLEDSGPVPGVPGQRFRLGRTSEGDSIGIQYLEANNGVTSIALFSDDLSLPTRTLAGMISDAAPLIEASAWLSGFADEIVPQLGALSVGVNSFAVPPYYALDVFAEAEGGILFVFRPFDAPPINENTFAPLVDQ